VTAGIIAEWILPLAGTAVLAAALLLLRTEEALATAWRRGAVPWFLATRVLWLFLFHAVLAPSPAPWSDLRPWEHMTDRMADGLPGRDFPNLYGPAFPWLLYLARLSVPGAPPWGTLLAFVAADALLVFAARRAATAALGRAAGLRVGLFLLLDPLGWHQAVVRAQDESLFALPLVAAAALLAAGRAAGAGGLLGAGVLATKPTLAPFALAVVAGGSRGAARLRALAVVAAVAGAGYGAALLLGMHPLRDLLSKAAGTPNFGMGISLSDALAQRVPSIPRGALVALWGIGCVAAAALAARAADPANPAAGALRGLGLVQCATMLFMPFCVSPYLAQGAAGTIAVILAALGGRPSGTAALLALAALHLLACWHLASAPWAGPALKAGSVLLHGGVAWLALAPRAPDAAVPGEEAA
jgi:hypothetical protein